MKKNRSFSEDLMEIIPTEARTSVLEWLAEQMPGGFFIYRADETTELLYVNRSTCDIYGCGSVEEFRELTGNTFRGMVHPVDYESIQDSINDQIAETSNSRSIDHVVYRIVRKDGGIRWVDDFGHFATLPGYGPVYYVFISDITETKLAEEEKKRAEDLEAALQVAEQASIAKTAFLSNMSHEIRTPITAILGMNEMIQREANDTGILEYSENIRKAGVSLLGIISDILDFSKIETGKMDLEYEEYSLASVVGDLYNLIRFRTEAKGLNLEFRIDPALPTVMIGDEIRIKQIITNLLTNAAKYTERGGIIFEMQLLGMRDGEAEFMISVTDTGIGIRQEDMERLFEPFDRLDMKKTRTIEGSGLGLAITRQLLSIMGSELRVESVYEKGSRFYFTITQRVKDETPVGELDMDALIHENPQGTKRGTMFTAPGMRLLVVDDTPMNLQVVAGLLKRTRMHIDVATSGAECIEKFGREHYDIVFLDYRMPQMNGIETLARLRESFPEKFAATPIISLTASAVSGDKEKMISAGFTDYLSKPVNIDEMERMMIKYLPADSVILTSDGTEGEDDEMGKLPPVIFDYPQLDPEKGLEYCGDAEDYLYALDTYEISVDSKAAQIEEDLKRKDLENYTLHVHSLKSTSSAIGAMELFEKAKSLEFAGKNGDLDTLVRETPFLLRDYRELRNALHRILGQYRAGSDAAATLAVVEEERSKVLARALEEAENANMARTAFLSNMSHEIRTPMNAIIGLYNIALRREGLDEETREILQKIGASARHLLSLINDIMDISYVESDHARLKNEEFSFGAMIEQINTLTESQCVEKGLEFDCRMTGPMDDYYIGDDMKLKQMILNVLGNAVRYTPAPGKVSFSVEEAERTKDRALMRFVVEDTGVGIDPDHLPGIFEPFSKAREGRSNSYGSTGLGLAITKIITDMMCGKIEVKSEKGKGSVFTITVPLGISGREVEDAPFDPARVRVLIVDDDMIACDHARKVLERVGFPSEYALSGREALVMIEKREAMQTPYQVILVDWKMPEMDGIELTREIRKRRGDEELTVILTTYNWDEIMEEAMDAGVNAFLAKPLFAGTLLQEIPDILSDRKKRREKPAHRADLAGRRILLAEDMEINAQIIRQVLQLREISADLVSNGEEAVRAFTDSREGTYDAILMDIRMPVMDGLKAAKAIRGTDRGDAGTVPIIALTANAFDEDVQLSLEAGMNAHLSKPVEPDALFRVLETLI